MLEETKSPIVEPHSNQSMPATTTQQEDITKEGQRKINLIWESTQSRIALFVVIGGLLMTSATIFFILVLVGILVFNDVDITANQLALLSIGITTLQSMNLTLGIVIGFYFSRTNHQAIGGTGKKDDVGRSWAGR